MYQDRDEIRQVYLDVWRKLKSGAILEPMEALIAEVIELHGEYQAILDDDEVKQQDYTPEQGRTNPFLHMGMHIALREQANTDRPPGVKAIYEKLQLRNNRHDIEHAMMECLGESLWTAQRDNKTPDEVSYLECLKKL